jgi:hypothetical protein
MNHAIKSNSLPNEDTSELAPRFFILDGSRKDIVNGIEYLYQANKNDIQVIYLSGVAGVDEAGNYVYFPSDVGARWADGMFTMYTNGVSINDILPVLNVTDKKIVIIDTDVNNRLINDLRQKDAFAFLPGLGGERVREYPALAHGVFTYSFLSGFRGEADSNTDGFVNAKELGDFILKTMPTLIGRPMPPATNDGGDFSLPVGLVQREDIGYSQQPLIYIPEGLESFIFSKVESPMLQNQDTKMR